MKIDGSLFILCGDRHWWVVYSSRHLRTPANIVIMNLAVSDFLMVAKMPIFLYNSLLQGPALGMKGIPYLYTFNSNNASTTYFALINRLTVVAMAENYKHTFSENCMTYRELLRQGLIVDSSQCVTFE